MAFNIRRVRIVTVGENAAAAEIIGDEEGQFARRGGSRGAKLATRSNLSPLCII